MTKRTRWQHAISTPQMTSYFVMQTSLGTVARLSCGRILLTAHLVLSGKPLSQSMTLLRRLARFRSDRWQ